MNTTTTKDALLARIRAEHAGWRADGPGACASAPAQLAGRRRCREPPRLMTCLALEYLDPFHTSPRAAVPPGPYIN
jgi:hypothetical protein